jgi:hypothetical protein
MNRRQKALLFDVITVTAVTAAAVVMMFNIKDYINYTEATRAMEYLGKIVLSYREQHGSVPPQSFIDEIKENLPGYARIGQIYYRAQWIDFGAPPDEILAYTEKNYHSFFVSSGFIVLRLDGRVEYLDKETFRELLAKQQDPLEKEMSPQ